MKVIFFGDIFGSAGRKTVREALPALKEEFDYDFCLVNAENAASGRGITLSIVQELGRMGIDAVTMGNHTWAQKEFVDIADEHKNIAVPLNMPGVLPGNRMVFLEKGNMKLCVVNLLGRVSMEGGNCPFDAMENVLPVIKKECKTIIVDFHAEATAEKVAFGWEFDGRLAAVLGTHTHVQTADERILERGTGYITDVGMCGPYDGVIGSSRQDAIDKLKFHYPVHLKPAKGRTILNAVFMDIDEKKGQTRSISRINRVINE